VSWQLPSLAALRTFEAAARHLSFTKAARELHLTQSAISRQIRVMEDSLGLKLFERVKQRLLLSEAGRAYVTDVRTALDQMQAATLNLLAHQGRGGIVNFATPPAFGMKWLIPRLAAFSSAHPDVLLNLVTRAQPFDFESERLDAAIHYGEDDWPGVISHRLIGEEIVLFCAPAYLERRRLRGPGDLEQHVLLQHARRPNAWREWLDAHRVHGVNASAGPRFEHMYMIMQAAAAGLGVALLPRLLVDDDVAAGRLVIPLEARFMSREAYCLVYPEAKRNDPKINVLRSWLLQEAESARRTAAGSTVRPPIPNVSKGRRLPAGRRPKRTPRGQPC
jgi:LysR family transcriptional regulator, glycine cleavage system transcriptional activator